MVPDAVLGVCVLCVLAAVALKELGPTGLAAENAEDCGVSAHAFLYGDRDCMCAIALAQVLLV